MITDPAATIAGGAITTLASTANNGASPTSFAGAGNVALLGSYMASLFASAEGQVGGQLATAKTEQPHATLAHPHTG